MNDNMTAIKMMRNVADIMESIECGDVDRIKTNIVTLKLNIEVLECVVKYFELTHNYN